MHPIHRCPYLNDDCPICFEKKAEGEVAVDYVTPVVFDGEIVSRSVLTVEEIMRRYPVKEKKQDL